MSRLIVKAVDVPVRGLFVPPTVIRLDDMEELDAEWFGPIIHVAMWKAGTLIETVERVNAKRFGLTMGLHSRIARAGASVESLAAIGHPHRSEERRGGKACSSSVRFWWASEP